MTEKTGERKLIWTEEELPQGSDEWLEWRKGNSPDALTEMTFGGSEVAALMYMNEWKTPHDIYDYKTGAKVQEFSEWAMEAIEKGNRLEPVARAHYESEFGVKTEQLCAIHPDYPWMRTSLDGITEDRKVILEIKSPKTIKTHEKYIKPTYECESCGKYWRQKKLQTRKCRNKLCDFDVTGERRVPAFRYPQLQWQIAVMREHFPQVERVDYISFFADEKLNEETGEYEIISTEMVVIPVYADEDFITELKNRAYYFIEHHLKPGIRPHKTVFLENEELIAYKPGTISAPRGYRPGVFI